MMEKKVGANNDWVQVTLRSKESDEVTTFVSAHLPHSGYTMGVFSVYMASLQRPPSQRIVFDGGANIDFTREGGPGEPDEPATRAAMVEAYFDSLGLQRHDAQNDDGGLRYTHRAWSDGAKKMLDFVATKNIEVKGLDIAYDYSHHSDHYPVILEGASQSRAGQPPQRGGWGVPKAWKLHDLTIFQAAVNNKVKESTDAKQGLVNIVMEFEGSAMQRRQVVASKRNKSDRSLWTCSQSGALRRRGTSAATSTRPSTSGAGS